MAEIEMSGTHASYFGGDVAARVVELEKQILEVGGSWEEISRRMDCFLQDTGYNSELYNVQSRPSGHMSQIQPCMVTACSKLLSGGKTEVTNTRTGKKICLNPAISHMVRQHHLLQSHELDNGTDGAGTPIPPSPNPYGIEGVTEFYTHFMSDEMPE